MRACKARKAHKAREHARHDGKQTASARKAGGHARRKGTQGTRACKLRGHARDVRHKGA